MHATLPDHPAWRDPLAALRQCAGNSSSCVLLYSSLRTGYSGRYSWLAWDEAERVEGDNFSSVESALERDAGYWFGWFGYALRHAVETVTATPPGIIHTPALRFSRYRYLLRWDHDEGGVVSFGETPVATTPSYAGSPIRVTSLDSPMRKEEYLRLVTDTIEHIHAGDFYQANITRKFHGNFEGEDRAGLFASLCAASPAPYSAYMHWPDVTVISSSPELFLRVDKGGRLTTRPIKGTKQQQDTDGDFALAEKDRAENLMIVDLMRNDLSRVALPGSVTVDKLFEADRFATLSHLSSEISAQLREDATPLDAVKACFPPGSMTGAPKIAAMEWCAKAEKLERGIYSGALGMIGRDSCELSVVIRTLLLQENRFEFQVGGGIVADSIADKEWEETITKARGILTALGIKESALRTL